MAAAGRRGHVGDVPGAEAAEQLAELGGLVVDVAAGRVQVEHQHPARRLSRRSNTGTTDGCDSGGSAGQRPGMPGREGAWPPSKLSRTCGVPASAAVTVRHASAAFSAASGAYGYPPRAGQICLRATRRVAAGQC